MKRWLLAALLLAACEPYIVIIEASDAGPPRDAGTPPVQGCLEAKYSRLVDTGTAALTVSAIVPFDGAHLALQDGMRWWRVASGEEAVPVDTPSDLGDLVEIYDAFRLDGDEAWLSALDDNDEGVLVRVDLARGAVLERRALGDVALDSIAGDTDGGLVYGAGHADHRGGLWQVNGTVVRQINIPTSSTATITRGAVAFHPEKGAFLVAADQALSCVYFDDGAGCQPVEFKPHGMPSALTITEDAVFAGTSAGFIARVDSFRAPVSSGLRSDLRAENRGVCAAEVYRNESVQALVARPNGGFVSVSCHRATSDSDDGSSCGFTQLTPPIVDSVHRMVREEGAETYLVGGRGGLARLWFEPLVE
ncbi:MAG: hypothetical protein RIT81_27400 [Deltaproteobacteria bacterium]